MALKDECKKPKPEFFLQNQTENRTQIIFCQQHTSTIIVITFNIYALHTPVLEVG